MAYTATILERISWIINAIFHQVLTVIVVYIIWTICHVDGLNNEMRWHVILNSLGYLFIMLEGIFIYTNENVYALDVQRKTKMTVHGLLMAVGFILSTTGIVLMINHVNTWPDSRHFKSTHGILGLLSWISVMITLIFGLFAKYTVLLRRHVAPVYVKAGHTFMGLLSLSLGLAALCLGIDKSLFRRASTGDTVIASTVAIALLALWAALNPLRSLYNALRVILFGK